MSDIHAMSEVIAASMGLMFRHMLFDGETYKPTCATLLSSTITAFLASIEVARHGFRRPYGAMARNIMEGLATILHISVEPEALQNFSCGKSSIDKKHYRSEQGTAPIWTHVRNAEPTLCTHQQGSFRFGANSRVRERRGAAGIHHFKFENERVAYLRRR
jgi:hypothetical protein